MVFSAKHHKILDQIRIFPPCLALNTFKMAKHIDIGKLGEDIACRFLRKKKYKILTRNYREKFDEIDIIAKSFDGFLVFIEVKTINLRNGLENDIMPEDNLTSEKIRKITRICTLFSAKHPNLLNDKKGWRLDLIAVTLNKEKIDQIFHYENIFKEEY